MRPRVDHPLPDQSSVVRDGVEPPQPKPLVYSEVGSPMPRRTTFAAVSAAARSYLELAPPPAIAVAGQLPIRRFPAPSGVISHPYRLPGQSGCSSARPVAAAGLLMTGRGCSLVFHSSIRRIMLARCPSTLASSSSTSRIAVETAHIGGRGHRSSQHDGGSAVKTGDAFPSSSDANLQSTSALLWMRPITSPTIGRFSQDAGGKHCFSFSDMSRILFLTRVSFRRTARPEPPTASMIRTHHRSPTSANSSAPNPRTTS